MTAIAVTTYYLEMSDPRDLRGKKSPRPDTALVRIDPPMPQLNRFFYTEVGRHWYWINRLSWSEDRWVEYANRAEIETWMLTVQGAPAGYFELDSQPGPDIEIAYFGLLPQYVGDGLGGYLLTSAIERAWVKGARRVWLHTCSLDHPSALANYQARGMRRFDEKTEVEDFPDKTSAE